MILHFDIDAFYASVAQRDDETLRGQPVAIAWRSRRSVVLTASYEARPFGVRSAMPLHQALSLCPHLVVVPPEFTKYREASDAVFAIFGEDERPVEGLSLDEAFVDAQTDDFGEAIELAKRVRARVKAEVRLTVSAGVATGKMVAKIASDSCKPDGLAAIEPGTEAAYLALMDVGKLWGIGPKSRARLREAGIETIGDLAALDDAKLFALFGRFGKETRELARGIDARRVESERETRSVSSETTFDYDIADEPELAKVVRELAADVAERLQKHGLSGTTVGIKIKKSDFTITGRQTSLSEPTDDAETIAVCALACLKRAELAGTPVRLLGVRVAGLTMEAKRQMSLLVP
ncbi:MAG: DNA polymerase IV [Candidatus Eremiobacteraeota bacterium]|nr:DNA polymerase IV [Candidatus Eremiobacteraeota bacterium]